MSFKKSLKQKLIHTLMVRGNKKTGEKILKKSLKLLQKSTVKRHVDLIQLAVVSSTPVFKINQQLLKKGKRKSKKDIPTFIMNNFLRTMLALRFISRAVKRQSSTETFITLTQELLVASTLKGNAVNQKTELQKQTLANKRYLSKFRW